MSLWSAGAVAIALGLFGCAAEVPNCGGCDSSDLHLNDILTVGTHNSYKQAIDPKLFAILNAKAPKLAPALDYSHPSLTDQLDDGARAIEIDVAYDPEGGLFAHPFGPALAGLPLPDGYSDYMSRPGFKVLHVQDFDFRSSCVTLHDCLAILKGWSRAHPSHVPILLTFNAKDDSLPQQTQALKFDAAAFDAMDAEGPAFGQANAGQGIADVAYGVSAVVGGGVLLGVVGPNLIVLDIPDLMAEPRKGAEPVEIKPCLAGEGAAAHHAEYDEPQLFH